MISETIPLALEGPIHIHISEQVREVNQCLEWSGLRPVEWLLEHTEVDQRWCLIHATHLSELETKKIARTGAVVGLCPTTEANLGDGLFPLDKYLNQEGRFGIGSDSNTSVDAAEELRLLEYGQRLVQLRRNISGLNEGASSGASLFTKALAGGAQALHQPIGLLAPGKRADLIVLGNSHPILMGKVGDTILDSWIFSGGRELITDVFVGGNQLIKDGRHKSQDYIEQRFSSTMLKLMNLV